jgi:hypothetical protein
MILLDFCFTLDKLIYLKDPPRPMEIQISREEKLKLYKDVVALHTGAGFKGDTMPYTSHYGHMYSFLNKQDVLALKLPKAVIANFLEKYQTRLAENYGIVQKEFAIVPDDLLQRTAELQFYFEISYNYVSSLKPKPSAKDNKKA